MLLLTRPIFAFPSYPDKPICMSFKERIDHSYILSKNLYNYIAERIEPMDAVYMKSVENENTRLIKINDLNKLREFHDTQDYIVWNLQNIINLNFKYIQKIKKFQKSKDKLKNQRNEISYHQEILIKNLNLQDPFFKYYYMYNRNSKYKLDIDTLEVFTLSGSVLHNEVYNLIECVLIN